MPTKLKVLIALLLLSSVFAALSQSWVSLVINVLFVIGVARGSEGARSLLLLLATLGLLASGYVLLVAVLNADRAREVAVAAGVL